MFAEKSAGPLRRLRLPAALAALLLSMAAWPAAAQSAPDDKAAAAAAKLEEVKAQSPSSADVAVPEEKDDGRPWLMDEKKGRRYRIEPIPKVEGTYRWVNENEVRFPGGGVFEVVDHDDKQFRVKAYEILRDEPRTAPVKVAVDPAKIAETYKFELAEVDKVSIVPFDKGLPQRGQWRNGFDLADIDKDGHLDIVFGPARKGRLAPNVFLGDGKGNWRPHNELRWPQQPYDYGDVATGDFNGDGHLDLAFGIHLKGLLVLVSDGRNSFIPWTKGIELDIPGSGGDASSFSSRAIDVVDWNKDGKLDVIAIGEGPKGLKTSGNPKDKGLINTSRGMRIYLNQGDGTWLPQSSSPLETQKPNFGDSFAMADFDKDGDLDVFAGTRQLGNNVLLGLRGDGGVIEFQPLEALRPRGMVNAAVARDFDRDGFVDLAVGYQSNEVVWRAGVDVFWGGKEGFKRQTLFNRENRSGVSGLDAGDLDGDGKLDLVAVDQASRVRMLLGDGKRGWVEEKNIGELPAEREGCTGWMVRLKDMDGDKRDEIVISYAGEPAGYPGMGDLSVAGCPNEGSLRVFSSRPKS
jgi:hypothetical protein